MGESADAGEAFEVLPNIGAGLLAEADQPVVLGALQRLHRDDAHVALVVRALNRLGATATMEEYIRYIFNIVTAEPADIQPVFGIGFEAQLHEEEAEARPGDPHRDALDEELAADERVILFGEDIAAAGGVFATTTFRPRAASRSMLSVPTAMFAIAFRSGQARSSSASSCSR